jgi:putative ABC transport system ATP-binding protein
VARALIVKPQIIFADEPTSNVDSETGLKILDLIVKQSSEKTAILVATHDPKVVDVASRIIGIRDGKVSDRIEAEFIPKHGATIGS